MSLGSSAAQLNVPDREPGSTILHLQEFTSPHLATIDKIYLRIAGQSFDLRRTIDLAALNQLAYLNLHLTFAQIRWIFLLLGFRFNLVYQPFLGATLICESPNQAAVDPGTDDSRSGIVIIDRLAKWDSALSGRRALPIRSNTAHDGRNRNDVILMTGEVQLHPKAELLSCCFYAINGDAI